MKLTIAKSEFLQGLGRLQSIVEKSRGTQLSIQSLRVVHLCPECDAGQLAIWNRSNTPLRPAELPHNAD